MLILTHWKCYRKGVIEYEGCGDCSCLYYMLHNHQLFSNMGNDKGRRIKWVRKKKRVLE